MDTISRETYKQLSVESKLDVLFDYIVAAHNATVLSDKKIDELTRKSLRWGSAGGIIAAVIAYLGLMLINHLIK